jgi:endoglucanase
MSRQRSLHGVAALLVATLALSIRVESAVFAASLSPLHPDGTRMVDASGKPVVLRGCNLGNWLMLEAWMLKWDIADQQTLIATLTDRFGEQECRKLMDSYREGYVTARDMQIVKSFGFNLVRVPFDSRLLMDEFGQMRDEPFRWLDRAVNLAEDAGIYVILDMHGVPGGQSTDHCTGQRNQNKLWTSETHQQQMAELWTRIAQHFKDRDAVIGYDLMNEPYGTFKDDMRPNLKALVPKLYTAVRSADASRLIIFPNTRDHGISFYGDLKSTGMTNIGFTDHFYAGLFSSPPTIESHEKVFGGRIPRTAEYLESQKSPMLAGEFNVVREKAGGKPMMRRYYDEFARRGWMCTMWSYKILKPEAGVQRDNWYMATNAEALPAIDPKTSSLEEIRGYIANLPTMPLAIDESLRDALTSVEPLPISLPKSE